MPMSVVLAVTIFVYCPYASSWPDRRSLLCVYICFLMFGQISILLSEFIKVLCQCNRRSIASDVKCLQDTVAVS